MKKCDTKYIKLLSLSFPLITIHSLSLSLHSIPPPPSLSTHLQTLVLGVAIGHVDMSSDDLVANIHLGVNFLVSLLKKNWQNIRTLHIKSSMGRPQRIF